MLIETLLKLLQHQVYELLRLTKEADLKQHEFLANQMELTVTALEEAYQLEKKAESLTR